MCKWTVCHYVPRTQSLRAGQLSDTHVFCKQIPVSQSLSWPRWPDQKARRMWRGDCFVLRDERRTSNQMTGSVGMKKRKNQNFNTAISLPDFVLFPLLMCKNSQHCWPNMLGVVPSVCTSINVWPVSNFVQQLPTTCNRVGVQTDATCDIQQRCELLPTMLRPFAWGLSKTKPKQGVRPTSSPGFSPRTGRKEPYG